MPGRARIRRTDEIVRTDSYVLTIRLLIHQAEWFKQPAVLIIARSPIGVTLNRPVRCSTTAGRCARKKQMQQWTQTQLTASTQATPSHLNAPCLGRRACDGLITSFSRLDPIKAYQLIEFVEGDHSVGRSPIGPSGPKFSEIGLQRMLSARLQSWRSTRRASSRCTLAAPAAGKVDCGSPTPAANRRCHNPSRA